MESHFEMHEAKIQEHLANLDKRLETRLTQPYKPIVKAQDVEFPAPVSLSYLNYVAAVLDNYKDASWEFKI